ncbi:MAG: carboxypeptidase-like regulatory domain-containing protein, partial [Cyclobacteriaceae bacterium]|nr:carboxypeptidase-like regulatory domain-containing protein [Cyclobacteriaceae bacterium]
HVYDLKGELINDAIVKIGDARMKYDHKMKVYRKSKTNQQGTLSVGFGGHTSYFEITRQHDNSRIKRIYRRIVYGTPLKYVARPVEFVLRIPFDAYRSIRHGYLAGTIYRLSHPFGSYYDLFDKLGCLFVRSSWCDLDHKYNGYFVTDKPKYKPGDTLKMKALIQTKKGKPKTDPLKLRLNNYRGEIKNVDLGWVYPTETGAYISRVVLHDSLQLGLDLWQNLQLIDEWGRSYMDGRFYYEEYELNNIYLNLRSNNTSHQRHDTVVVYAKANDDNDLPVPDGELFITITSREIYQYHADHVFVPDTLWTHRIKLETIGETKIILPDSIFPEASMSYIITGRLQTSDGKTETKELHLRNFSQNRLVHFDDHNDSLRVYMTEASKETTGTARVRVYHQDQEMPAAVFDMPLPGQVAMNPLSTKITVETASVQRSFSLQEVSPRLQISAVRTADSLYIEAINPRKIPFHWQLYYRNNPLQQGRGETLKINRKAKGRGEYFIAIQYLWANRPYSENYVVGFREKELNIAIEAPAIIVPGDEKEISISVKDQQNRAVEGVDLLAFGLTGKFKNFSTPPLPDYNKPVMTRKMINEFDNRPQSFDIKEKWLDYKAWKKQFGLDSVEYYRFIYPDSLYINRVKSPGNITQLAPFVMGGGRPLPVQVITIDHRPVYFSWAHNNRYAFRLDSGYHQLRLRTFAKEYVLDSFYVEHGKKNMVSFASDYEGQEVKQHKRKSKLKDGEKENYNTYVIRLRKDEYGLSYLQDGHNIHRLMNNSNYAQTYTIGPLYDRHFNYVIPEIHLYKDVEREPFYTYHFRPDRVKLTSYLPKTSGPRFSFSIPEYRDFVLTNRDIALELDQIKKDMLQDPSFYDDPGRKKQGLGELMLHYDSIALKGRGMPMVCMLRKTDEIGYFHVGPGKEVYFHNLKAGRYELVGLYYDSAYFKLGALEVREGGTNYFRVDSLNIAGHDMFWQETFDYLLKKATENYKTSAGSGKRYPRVESRVVREIYSNNYLFTQGNVVSGFVYDQEDELGIPGVAVMIKGTDRGVATDINGRYSITVPDGPCTLVYSFIGYVQIEEKRQGPGEVNVYMSPDVTQLEEVVVVGYGSQRMQNMTASVVTVSSALQGRVAGVEITGSKGTIQIRGVSSVSGANAPLIIVDGVPFAGDISKLDPSLIQQAEMLKDESLTAIYG